MSRLGKTRGLLLFGGALLGAMGGGSGAIDLLSGDWRRPDWTKGAQVQLEGLLRFRSPVDKHGRPLEESPPRQPEGSDSPAPTAIHGGYIDPSAEDRIDRMLIPEDMKKRIRAHYHRTGYLPTASELAAKERATAGQRAPSGGNESGDVLVLNRRQYNRYLEQIDAEINKQ